MTLTLEFYYGERWFAKAWTRKGLDNFVFLVPKGESGLGKSTLVNSLFLTDLYKDRKLLNAEGKTAIFLFVSLSHCVIITSYNVLLFYTVYETYYFGTRCHGDISQQHPNI